MAANSFPEFLDSLLENPKHALGFLSLIALCFGVVATVVCGAMWFLQWRQILPDDAKVEGFEVHFTTSPTNKMRRYFFVVHAQGWQETPVRVNKGDRVEINAAGSITIDMWGINTYSTRRDKIDRAIKANALRKGEWTALNVPEDFYSRKDYQSLMLESLQGTDPLAEGENVVSGGNLNVVQRIKPARGWTGPLGYSDNPQIDTAYPARRSKRISTVLPYGALLGTIAPQVSSECTTEMVLKFKYDCVPILNKDPIFSVARIKNPANPTADGEERALWLIVNDVLDEKDPVFPEKFFVDNSGFFYVEVVVTPAKN